MKFVWTVTYISKPIEIGKDEKKTTKRILWLESNEVVENPDRIAIDFLWDKEDVLEESWCEDGDLVVVYFSTSYKRYTKDDWSEVVYNSLRWWKIEVKDKNKPADTTASDDDVPF